MQKLRVFNNREELTSDIALRIAEGTCQTKATELDTVKAYAYLIYTGMAWSMPRNYANTANNLIQLGIISPGGNIDWNVYDQIVLDIY